MLSTAILVGHVGPSLGPFIKNQKPRAFTTYYENPLYTSYFWQNQAIHIQFEMIKIKSDNMYM